MSKTAKKSSLNDLPLLDEVNELIEKERLLLSLKVLEQQKEAQEWKAKYDILVGKVSDTATRTGDFRQLEAAAKSSVASETDSSRAPSSPTRAKGTASATSSSSSSSSSTQSAALSSASSPSSSSSSSTVAGIQATPEALQSLLSTLRHPWVLDVSRRAVKPAFLTLVNSDVFPVRGPTAISVARLPHCSMGDDCSTALGAMVSRLGLEAADLSFNDLGPSLVAQLNAGLKTRRKTPQYLLLHGNMQLGSSPVPFTTTLQSLTDSTWGLSVSLPDLSHGTLSGGKKHHAHAHHDKPPVARPGARPASSSSKSAANKPRDTSAIQELYDSPDHPQKSLAFLTELLNIVDPNHGTTGAKGLPTSKKGKQATAKDPKDAKEKGVIRTSKVTTLAFLGLSHAHLSMQSVAKLSAVLKCISPSLTDLDLSFAYIGLHGARALRTYMESSRCQIVRLGVCGNNIGDDGSAALSDGLRRSKTLTALDLRSNNITPTGLRSLCSALVPGKFGGAGGVIHIIDLRGNPVPQAAAIAAQSELRSHGSGVTLRSGPTLPLEFTLDASTGAPSIAPAKSVSAGSSSSSSSGAAAAAAAVSAAGFALLATAKGLPSDSLVLFQHPYLTFSPFRLNVGDDDKSTTCEAAVHSIDLRYASAHYSRHSGHPLCLEFDIRPSGPSSQKLQWVLSVHSASHDRVLYREKLTGSSCLEEGGTGWARCRAVLRDLPVKGSLELTVEAPEGTSGGVECSNLVLYTITPSPLLCIGHDESAWNSAENASTVAVTLGSAFGCQWQKRLPRGFSVLRTIKVTTGNDGTSGAGTHVRWESKLATSAGKSRGLGLGQGLGPGGSMGYEWMVLIGACQGASCIVAAKGKCFPDVEGGAEETKSRASSAAALRPWVWSSIIAELPAEQLIMAGDSIILAARPKSLYEGSVVQVDDGASEGLAVQARGVVLSVPQDATKATISACTGTTMLVSHNAASWEM